MNLTSDHIALIRSSFVDLMSDFDPWHTRFYEIFFRLAPHVKSMFRDDIVGQEMRFMTTLKVIVDNLDQPDVLKPRYAELGHTHAILGVKRKDFDPMGEALIETIRETLGDAFTRETEAAWRQGYRHVADQIIAGAGLG
ncbi:MAG: hypothetical protein GXP05_10250 [Alphaproteobacteria bacterium]|nr:hypothetical protein [Alphaproteobacteria bacterium]